MAIGIGKYRARVVEANVRETMSGKPYAELIFAADGDHIASRRWLTDAAIERTIKELRLCGWQGDDVTDLSSCVGGEVEIVTDEGQEYQGRVPIEVRWINALRPELAPEKKAALRDRVRRTMGVAPQPAEPPESGLDDHDEVPF